MEWNRKKQARLCLRWMVKVMMIRREVGIEGYWNKTYLVVD